MKHSLTLWAALAAACTAPALLHADEDAPPPPAPEEAAPEEAAPAEAGEPAAANLPPGLYARLETSLGTLTLRLEHEKAPVTVANFVGLIEGTVPWTTPAGEQVQRPFYDGLTFHRVIDGFMIQGGCPQGTGTGGPGYRFRDEFPPDKSLRHDGPGVLSMANADRGKRPWTATGQTNGSQFFITLGPTPHLDGLHSVFGRLVEGQEVLKAIGAVPTGVANKPREPVVIRKATVLRVGEAAAAFDAPAVFAEREERLGPSLGAGAWKPKEVPPAEGEVDPARVPGEEQEERDPVDVKLFCVQYSGCARQQPGVTYTKEEALEVANRIAAHCRLQGADVDALIRKWSDLPPRVWRLEKAKNDPSLAPAFRLAPGQVSEAVVTPFGVMVFVAQ